MGSSPKLGHPFGEMIAPDFVLYDYAGLALVIFSMFRQAQGPKSKFEVSTPWVGTPPPIPESESAETPTKRAN